jgi:preprotein translocase subunit SecE
MSVLEKANEYRREVVAEAAKVSWPTRKEIVASTWVVIIAVAILAVFLFLVDQVLVRALGLLFGTPGA